MPYDKRYTDYYYDALPICEDPSDVASYAGRLQQVFPEWRRGQAWFNALSRVRPELAEKARQADLSPYYVDGKIGVFIDFIYTNWNEL